MKRFIVAVMILLTACASGSMTRLSEAEKSIETIIELPGNSREDIYDSSKKWLAETLQSPRAVIENENRETDTILGNGVIAYPCKGMECVVRGSWKVSFKLKIEARESKVITTYNQIQLSMPPPADQGSESYNPGRIAPVWSEADMAAIKPTLLKFNDQLKKYIIDMQANKNR